MISFNKKSDNKLVNERSFLILSLLHQNKRHFKQLDVMCKPQEITSGFPNYHSITQQQNFQHHGQQRQQQQVQRGDGISREEDVETLPTTTNTHNNNLLPPLLLGPLRFLSTSQTSQSGFIPPPYLVVEIDDGHETTMKEEQEEVGYDVRSRNMNSTIVGRRKRLCMNTKFDDILSFGSRYFILMAYCCLISVVIYQSYTSFRSI